jgi:hypothetical protein
MSLNTEIETVDLPGYKIQFVGKIDGQVVGMSLPEPDDGEEICEFPGYQWVQGVLNI